MITPLDHLTALQLRDIYGDKHDSLLTGPIAEVSKAKRNLEHRYGIWFGSLTDEEQTKVENSGGWERDLAKCHVFGDWNYALDAHTARLVLAQRIGELNLVKVQAVEQIIQNLIAESLASKGFTL